MSRGAESDPAPARDPATHGSLGPRLAAIEARTEIGEVLTRYCTALDNYDIALLEDVFTPDCVIDIGAGRGGAVRGLVTVLAGFTERHARFTRTQHLLGQSVITVTDDTAVASTYVLAWHEYPDETTATVRLRYDDQLRKTRAGWRISARRAVALGSEGFDKTEWTWHTRRSRDAPRRAPDAPEVAAANTTALAH